VRATDDVSGIESASKRYLVGPTLEIGLPLRLSVEFDALYRREGYQGTYGNFAFTAVERERANSWEFPLLVKYRLSFPLVKPFAEVGYAPRVINGNIEGDYTLRVPTTQPAVHYTRKTDWATSHGIVIGGGVDLGIGRVHLSPGVRYTRWNNSAVSVAISDGVGFQSSQNQVDVVLGVRWKFH